MTEEEWVWGAKPADILGRLSASLRKRRLFCVACCGRVIASTCDPVVQEALMVAERYADGWERRSMLLSVGDRIKENMNPLDRIVKSWTTCVNQAVEELCHTGTEFNPSEVIYWITEALEQNDVDTIAEDTAQRELLRDIFGNPFRPVAFDPAWRTSTTIALARQMYDSRDFGIMPILGDALQDAGCDNADILDHCRGAGPHVRGCWVVDLVLGKS